MKKIFIVVFLLLPFYGIKAKLCYFVEKMDGKFLNSYNSKFFPEYLNEGKKYYVYSKGVKKSEGKDQICFGDLCFKSGDIIITEIGERGSKELTYTRSDILQKEDGSVENLQISSDLYMEYIGVYIGSDVIARDKREGIFDLSTKYGFVGYKILGRVLAHPRIDIILVCFSLKE